MNGAPGGKPGGRLLGVGGPPGGPLGGKKLGLACIWGGPVLVPFGTAVAATAFFQSRGAGTFWKFLSSSFFTLRGRKCPAFDFFLFSYILSSTNVIITDLNMSRRNTISPRPITEP